MPCYAQVSGYKAENWHDPCLEADLSLMSEVRRLGEEVAEKCLGQKLGVLACGACRGSSTRQLSTALEKFRGSLRFMVF